MRVRPVVGFEPQPVKYCLSFSVRLAPTASSSSFEVFTFVSFCPLAGRSINHARSAPTYRQHPASRQMRSCTRLCGVQWRIILCYYNIQKYVKSTKKIDSKSYTTCVPLSASYTMRAPSVIIIIYFYR
jgi:hypothetical protein